MSFQHWTPEQWSVFTVTVAAGVIAAAVLAVLRRARWTAPAPLRARGPAPRPSIVRAQLRMTDAEIDAFKDRWRASYGNGTPAATWIDPMRADFTDPGIGALSSIQAVTVDPTLRTEAEIEAEDRAWVGAYSDLTYFMPETDAAREQMRINTEPAMRTARLWLMLAGEVGAKAVLADWRMDTPTGEYAPIDRQHLMARALLVS
jgi:hypothetical protein